MKEYAVHPDAAIFPMMSDDELAALAEDIKENGLIHPIVIGILDNEEVIVDGRNRLKACEIAGVKPAYKKLNGEDLKAFIISANINRRHMTGSQRAMAVALIYPEGAAVEANGRFKKDPATELKKNWGVPGNYLQMARIVLRQSRPVAETVLAGDKSVVEAYNEAEKQGGEAYNRRTRMRKLREARPDLADLVQAEQMALPEAEAKAKADAEARKQQRWAATVNLIDGIKLLDRDAETASDIAKDFDPAIVDQRGETFTPARLRRVATFVTALAHIMEQDNAQDV